MIVTTLIEKREVVDGLEIKYMFKPASLDVNHIVVVFSDFNADKNKMFFTGETLKDIPSHVLWIADDFNGMPCYYMCIKRDFSIEEKITKFINNKLSELSLTKDNTTVLGISKGAFASLYYGIKYEYKNIISCCPQINLGSFLKGENYSTIRDAMYDISKNDNEDFFNKILHRVIESKKDISQYIYLIYSDCDEYVSADEYNTILTSMRKKGKFISDIKINSLLVASHDAIAPYCIPFVKSILVQNSINVSPYYCHLTLGNLKSNTFTNKVEKLVPQYKCYLHKVEYSSRKLQFKLLCINRCASELDEETLYIILENNLGDFYKFKLSKITIPKNEQLEINSRYFQCFYTDFSNSLYQITNAIDINTLKPSLYDLSLLKKIDGKEQKVRIESISNVFNLLNKETNVLGKIFSYKDNTVKLYISNIISNREPDLFKITKKIFVKSSLYLEGYFVKYDLVCEDYSDLDFYMVFHNSQRNLNTQIRFGKISNYKLNTLLNGECLLSKCGFAPIGLKIIELGKNLNLNNGEYDIYISMISLTHVYSFNAATIKINNNIIIDHNVREKEFSNLLIDIDKNNVSELLKLPNELVSQSILKNIEMIQMGKLIDVLRYMKIKDYLKKSNNLILLDYLDFVMQNILKNDMYEELK